MKALDPAAWRRLTTLYGPLVYGWARRAGLRGEDAADVTQEVFRAVAARARQLRHDRPGDTFRGWLWTITRRRWADRRRRAVLPLDPGRDPDDVAADTDAPGLDEAEFRSHLIQHVVPSLRGGFHESTWRAFWKHVVEGRPAADVAAEEGVSVAAVYKAKLRVTAHLHKELGDLVAD